MGGKSSSKTSSTTTNNVDNRVFNLEDSQGAMLTDIDSGGGDVTFTDHGAIAGAMDLGGSALDLGESVVETLADFGSNALEINSNVVKQQATSNSENLATLKNFATDLQTEGQLALSDTMKTVTIAVVVVSGVVMVTMMRGKK